MEITAFASDDTASLREYVRVVNTASAHDADWLWPLTEHGARGMVEHGWDGEPRVPYLARVDREVVGAGSVAASDYDNLRLAWIDLVVDPARRGRGHGSDLLAGVERICLERGRTNIGVSVWEATGAERFALAHGYERRQVGVNRRQVLADVDQATVSRLHDEAAAAAVGYELVRWPATTPSTDLEPLVAMAAAINDSPTDDLDIDDEQFSPERMVAYESAQRARGHLLHRLVVRHRATGELAGQSVVAVDAERPRLAHQHDTSVLAAHRGHRLGALLKTGMLRWLAEAQPQVEQIDTFNAESNAFMISVNEALGYRVMGRELNLQKTLT